MHDLHIKSYYLDIIVSKHSMFLILADKHFYCISHHQSFPKAVMYCSWAVKYFLLSTFPSTCHSTMLFHTLFSQHEMHSDALISTAQQEGSRFKLHLSVWTLHARPVSAQVPLQVVANFLQSKDKQLRLTGNSTLPVENVTVNGCMSVCALWWNGDPSRLQMTTVRKAVNGEDGEMLEQIKFYTNVNICQRLRFNVGWRQLLITILCVSWTNIWC